MDTPRKLFEKYKAGGLPHILAVAQGEEPETLYLDFKTIPNNKGPISKDELKTYAKGLSAFANAEGGLIVWGIECRSTGNEDPDTTKSTQPIDNLKETLAQLESRGDLISPGLSGIEHFPIEDSSGSNRGFILTFIPKCDGLPQMAKGKDTNTFYCRIGSRSYPMEHYMIADRFRERPLPKLELALSYFQHAHEPHKFELVIGIKNSGRGIALYPGIGIDTNSGSGLTALNKRGYFVNMGGYHKELPTENERWIFFTTGGSEFCIYPGLCSEAAAFTFEKHDTWPTLEINYELFCDGFYEKAKHSIAGQEIPNLPYWQYSGL